MPPIQYATVVPCMLCGRFCAVLSVEHWLDLLVSALEIANGNNLSRYEESEPSDVEDEEEEEADSGVDEEPDEDVAEGSQSHSVEIPRVNQLLMMAIYSSSSCEKAQDRVGCKAQVCS